MQDRRLLIAGLIIVGVFLLRLAFVLAQTPDPNLLAAVGQETVLVGTVVNDPEERESSLHAHVRIEEINAQDVRGKVLVILPRGTELEYGDRVVVNGKLALPVAFETDAGRIFNYPQYLKVKGIAVLMRYTVLEKREGGGVSLQKTLFALKHRFELSIENIFPEPSASLIEGILLGEKRGIPQELNNAFIAAGLIHIVVLSGYNINIVAETILRFFALFLPKRVALGAGAFGILLFAVMAGAGATVVRATLMGLIAILARYLERPGAALRALFFAAGAMALWNPLSVLYDPSFILSVAATFGLITLSPWVERYLGYIPKRGGLRSIAASTIAVQIYILPILLYLTGVFSLFALPANMLALPLVPLTMLGGFAAGALGLLHPMVALPLFVVTHILLLAVMYIAEGAARLPLSALLVPAFPLWVALFVYVPLTYFAVRCYLKYA